MTLQSSQIEAIINSLGKEPELMTSARVMDILDISRTTLYRLIAKGDLVRVKKNKELLQSPIRITKASVVGHIKTWA